MNQTGFPNITHSFIHLINGAGLSFYILPEDIRGVNVQEVQVKPTEEGQPIEKALATVILLPHGQNLLVQNKPEDIFAAIRRVNEANMQAMRDIGTKSLMLPAGAINNVRGG